MRLRSIAAPALALIVTILARPALAQSAFPDTNLDGVPDFVDAQCTCSVSAWKNHGRYVSCVASVVETMGLDPVVEADIMQSAAHSPCAPSNAGNAGGNGGGNGCAGGGGCGQCHKSPGQDLKGPLKCSACHKK